MTLQSILGSNYKWLYLHYYNFKIRLSSTWDSLFFVIGQLLTLSGTILIWWLASGKTFDVSFQSKLTYFIFGEMFFCLIFNFTSFDGYDILRGLHTRRLIVPSNYFTISFFKNYGDAFLQSFSKFCFLLLGVIIFHNYLFFNNAVSLVLTLLMIPISILIFFMIEIAVSFVAFWLTRINGVILNFGFMSSFLAGRLFPLGLLIEGFELNLMNPFAFLFYHPMQIYLGKYNINQTLLVFAGGIIWCILLFVLARIIFKLGLKKNEAVGL